MENIGSVRNLYTNFSFSQGSMGGLFGCEGCTVDQLTSGFFLEKEIQGTSIWTNDMKKMTTNHQMSYVFKEPRPLLP